MKIEDEILFNQFGQGVQSEEKVMEKFEPLDINEKRAFLREIEYLIIQSKVRVNDIDEAIKKGKLKSTFTPCVILKKGLNHGNFEKVINLPENELGKVYKLFINLFKVGYYRRYLAEKGDSNKWWYWDLSDERNVERVQRNEI